MLGKCKCCRQFKWSVKTRARNTAYVDDENNYLKSCLECAERDYEYFKELWADYYSGCL
jgi:hypothetical protein